MPLFLPKSFPVLCSKFSGESRGDSPYTFPLIHPNSQSHSPLLQRRPPSLQSHPRCSPPRARRLFIQPRVRHAPGARTATTNPAEWGVCKERAQGTGGGRGGEEGEFREWVGGGGKRRGKWGLQPLAAAAGSGGRGGARAARGAGCPIEKAAALRPPSTLSLLARERGRRTDREPAREGE